MRHRAINSQHRALAFACCLASAFVNSSLAADEDTAAGRFRKHVQPLLDTYCYGCHGYGASEGNRTLDEFESDEALVGDIKLWWAVLRNVRAGIMPPAGEERPTDDERQRLFDWIQRDVFQIDPANPDPGRVTLRRLNRVEYRNTIRDLMGVEYNTTENFPADDTGYGFDNIGDALSMSPLLMEKYLKAAEDIVKRAVPSEPYIVEERRIDGERFRSKDGDATGERLSYYKAATVTRTLRSQKAGKYQVVLEIDLDGNFEFDPARCRVTFSANGKELHEEEYGWADRESRRHEFEAELDGGECILEFKLEPLVAEDQKINSMDYRIRTVMLRGPLGEEDRIENKQYTRFFPNGPAPESVDERDDYAREVIARFVHRAYRRPADEATIDRLADIAKATYTHPGQSFEAGISSAMVAVLASPRFLFRIEDTVGPPSRGGSESASAAGLAAPTTSDSFPLIDEHSLASRLSYFLWSSMPDEELLRLADAGELRKNLPQQIERMLEDSQSDELIENFAGQWLRARDVEHVTIDPVAALGRQEEFDRIRAAFRRLRDGRGGRRRGRERRRRDEAQEEENETPRQRAKREEEEKRRNEERARIFAEFRKFDSVRDLFNGELRNAMRRETEMYFEHIVREDRSLLELIDSDYTFLNGRLAKHYGIEGVEGREMRRVELPEGSPRGGLLTQGTLLAVTSNPTRTSPVKRGLYILENILGTPPPPPPNNIPPLESAADEVKDHEPTVRELQEIHRRDPLCHSCHARMDPLGLALENFNALGMWRDEEHDQPIDASGTLLTGEEFDGIRELKRILAEEHRLDFYRCLTEKLLTYALGRGLEYYDEHAIDQIVAQLDQENGKFSILVKGVIESAPFQRQRRPETVAVNP
jgi:hypothetical protein